MAATNGGLKREAESNEEETASKKAKEEPKTPKEEALSNLQYRHLPYQEQLKKKQEEASKTFKEFNKLFVKTYPKYATWYNKEFLDQRFKMDTIMTSPKTEAYRNKCELTIGFNPELNKLCAGPRVSDGENGRVQVGPCDADLIHLTPSMIDIAQDFSNFLDKWNYLEEKCPWYNLFIRVTKKGDHMLIFIIKEDTQEKLKEMKNEIVAYYTSDYDNKHTIKSIYLQPRPENSNKKAYELEFLHCWGEEYLEDEILDLKLVVTPGIYFRINSYAAEITFQKVIDVGNLNKKRTLVIDLWCGCGVLSLLMAKRANYVVAIDPSKWNIKKAQFMAKHNKIRNIEFIIAKPEDGLRQIWRNLQQVDEVVVTADPPTLCKMFELGDMMADIPCLKRFVYIHSSHKLHLVKNLINLTSASLIPTRVIPVDVSPHSVRLEIIALLRKVDPNAPPLLGAGPGGIPDAAKAAWIEEIERRAFAMGMAQARTLAPPVSAASRYDDPLDDYDTWGGGYSRGRASGGGYGGQDFGYGGPKGGYGAGSGGFGRSGFGAEADGGYVGGFGGGKRGGIKGKRGARGGGGRFGNSW